MARSSCWQLSLLSAQVVQVPGQLKGRAERTVPLCWPWCDSCHPVPPRSWFEDHGLAGKLRAIQTVSCLLQGPCDAGNRALELSGVMESVIALCASEREEEQLVAVEALIHAAGKAKRASFITANGVSLLKDLYKRSEKDSIRIRALVVRWVGLVWAHRLMSRGPWRAGVSGCSPRTLQGEMQDMQGLVQARGMGPGSPHRAQGQVREMSPIQRAHPTVQAAHAAPWRWWKQLREEVMKEFGGHAVPGWSEGLCRKAGLQAAPGAGGLGSVGPP